jgi:hypothetical protein
MKLQRSAALGAASYERTESRRGYANRCKPKTVTSRLGKLQLQVPQTRGVAFYPAAFERSERALKLALAEMYLQGVSTRKVAEITRELCGCDVSSMQLSRGAELLDAELDIWRNRPLGATPYLILNARYEQVRHGGSVVDCALLFVISLSMLLVRVCGTASVTAAKLYLYHRRPLRQRAESEVKVSRRGDSFRPTPARPTKGREQDMGKRPRPQRWTKEGV